MLCEPRAVCHICQACLWGALGRRLRAGSAASGCAVAEHAACAAAEDHGFLITFVHDEACADPDRGSELRVYDARSMNSQVRLRTLCSAVSDLPPWCRPVVVRVGRPGVKYNLRGVWGLGQRLTCAVSMTTRG